MKDFGDNEGALKAFFYEPDNATPNMPLVVVLHGCSQNAADVAKLTDWNKLADQYGFYVLYPQQKRLNNVSKCFNWFQSKDIEKAKGECLSIHNMTAKLTEEKGIDKQRIYITGLSAGAAMSMVMIATYPEMYAGAAILSGGPYKSAEKIGSSYKALRGKVDKTPEEWGDLVREENENYTGNYPKLIVFHGKKDLVVDFKNSNEMVEQWSNVLELDINNTEETTVTDDIKRIDYKNSSGDIMIRKIEIEKMGHAVATNPGSGEMEGGSKGIFGKDKDYFSTYWIASFFDLIQ